MCGICGQYSINGVESGALHTMAKTLRHRGPDDEGYYVNGIIGLGSRRLSIIDIQGGKQPISNENDTIWIVFNGEIYNYPELRKYLLERGHQFKTHTDTEVIIHLYEEHGLDSLKELRGMFAFAVWDQPQNRLFVARDPLGQKQLYYTRRPGEFAFASEIKALLAVSSSAPQMNTRAMHHLISLRCLPETDTLFEGIEKLPAGHALVVEDGDVRRFCYWDLRYEPKLKASERDLTAHLRDLLIETIQGHMVSDVPLGAFLSGGIDSSLITAMMSTLSDTPINTFSVGVEEDSFNELPYARLVADKYTTKHHEVVVKPNLVATLPEMISYMEEPVDPFAFGVYSVARLASQHVKVALGGDGGDEMFAGYDRYLGNQLTDLYCLLPPLLRSHVIEPLIRRLPDNFGYNNRVQKLRWLVAMSDTGAADRYARSATFLRFSHEHKRMLYTADLWEQLGGIDSSLILLARFEVDNAADPLDRMLYVDVKTRLSDHLLVVNDRMTMAHSLEGRSPYVDHKIAEFVAAIPSEYKLRGRRLKYILREVAREYLPPSVVDRPKQGFSFPLAYWFRGELYDTTANMFGTSRLAEDGFFRRDAMFDFLDEHVQGKIDHNYRLWLLLNLELWYRHFIDGIPQGELQDLLLRTAAAEAQVTPLRL